MPEGDTVHLAATRLHAALAGRLLTRTDFRVPRYAALDLSGRGVDAVVARGKHILMRVDGGTTIHSHLKMEGEWHLYRVGERWQAPGWQARLVLETEAWTAVGFRLGVVDVVPTTDEARLVGHLGPDLLGEDWDADVALANLNDRGDAAIGDALLDQTIVAGLGTIWRSEACWRAAVDPWRPTGEITDDEARDRTEAFIRGDIER